MENLELLNQLNMHELKELMENDNMVFDIDNLSEYINTSGAYGWIYRLQNKPIGFAYGCRLAIPDGTKEIYLHSIDILPEYQGKGHGTNFFESILSFARENRFSKLFLCSSQSLPAARRIYEKFGGFRECQDEIIFSYLLN